MRISFFKYVYDEIFNEGILKYRAMFAVRVGVIIYEIEVSNFYYYFNNVHFNNVIISIEI